MSILQIVKVWDHQFTRGQQAVMIALADHAHDDGTEVRPSIGRIAWKTGYSRRQTQRIIKELADQNILRVQKEATNKTPRVFFIDWDNAAQKEPFKEFAEKARGVRMSPQSKDSRGDISDTLGVTSVTSRGDISDILGCHGCHPNRQRTVKETSVRNTPLPPEGKTECVSLEIHSTSRVKDSHSSITPVNQIQQLKNSGWDSQVNLPANRQPHSEVAIAYEIYNRCKPELWGVAKAWPSLDIEVRRFIQQAQGKAYELISLACVEMKVENGFYAKEYNNRTLSQLIKFRQGAEPLVLQLAGKAEARGVTIEALGAIAHLSTSEIQSAIETNRTQNSKAAQRSREAVAHREQQQRAAESELERAVRLEKESKGYWRSAS